MSSRPSRKGGRPRDARIDERVLAAARQLLQERGLRAMSLDAIADLAGVSRSAIYRRWSSTDELILDALDDVLGQLPGPDPDIDIEAFWQEVRAGLRTAVEGLGHPIERDAIQLWLARLIHQPQLHSRYWERRVAPRRQRAINSLKAAVDDGRVLDTGAEDLLIDMLAGLLLYRYFLTPEELRFDDDEQWLDRVVTLAERLLEQPR